MKQYKKIKPICVLKNDEIHIAETGLYVRDVVIDADQLVVNGIFAGHHHSDMYLYIMAKTFDGKDAVIPQFINTAIAYDDGHLMRILIK